MCLSSYASGLILIAALAAFCELISYKCGEDKGHKLAISVILLYSIISPLVPLVESIPDFDISEIIEENEETLSEGAYLEVGEEAFREGVLSFICEKWGLAREQTVVTLIGFDFQNMRCERIIITLAGKGASVDFREIENYIKTKGLGDCEVRYIFE